MSLHVLSVYTVQAQEKERFSFIKKNAKITIMYAGLMHNRLAEM